MTISRKPVFFGTPTFVELSIGMGGISFTGGVGGGGIEPSDWKPIGAPVNSGFCVPILSGLKPGFGGVFIGSIDGGA